MVQNCCLGHFPLVTAEDMMRKEARKGCGVECGESDVQPGEGIIKRLEIDVLGMNLRCSNLKSVRTATVYLMSGST